MQLHLLAALFGGYNAARVWHFWLMWLFILFVVPHVFLVFNDPAKGICNAFLDYAVRKDDRLRQAGEADRIADKTVFIIKRN